jgi:CobQ-like glutamine amidotransferase family enzyme
MYAYVSRQDTFVCTYMKKPGGSLTRIGQLSSMLLTEALKVAIQMRIALSQGRAKRKYKSQKQQTSD